MENKQRKNGKQQPQDGLNEIIQRLNTVNKKVDAMLNKKKKYPIRAQHIYDEMVDAFACNKPVCVKKTNNYDFDLIDIKSLDALARIMNNKKLEKIGIEKLEKRYLHPVNGTNSFYAYVGLNLGYKYRATYILPKAIVSSAKGSFDDLYHDLSSEIRYYVKEKYGEGEYFFDEEGLGVGKVILSSKKFEKMDFKSLQKQPFKRIELRAKYGIKVNGLFKTNGNDTLIIIPPEEVTSKGVELLISEYGSEEDRKELKKNLHIIKKTIKEKETELLEPYEEIVKANSDPVKPREVKVFRYSHFFPNISTALLRYYTNWDIMPVITESPHYKILNAKNGNEIILLPGEMVVTNRERYTTPSVPLSMLEKEIREKLGNNVDSFATPADGIIYQARGEWKKNDDSWKETILKLEFLGGKKIKVLTDFYMTRIWIRRPTLNNIIINFTEQTLKEKN